MLDDDQGFAFEGDKDEELVPELIAASVDVLKTRDNSFYETDLDQALDGVEKIVMAGVSTHTCVAATAVEAYARNFEIILVSDAIATEKPELHDHVLDLLRDEYRQRLVAADAIEFLAASPSQGGGVRLV